MHSIVMMMKTHSYTALNGDLSVKLRRLEHLKKYVPNWISEHQVDLDQGKQMGKGGG